MPQIKSKDPTTVISFRVKRSVEETLARIAALLTNQSTDNEYSERQAGQAVLERYASAYEKELLRKANTKDLDNTTPTDSAQRSVPVRKRPARKRQDVESFFKKSKK